ncbi:hypothetical protein GF348_09995 [candidate division KSB3 bacterium]|nr:hypothetical protein [candidate division KSB3 bacterium]
MKVTVDKIMSAGTCMGYPRERVEELVGDGVTVDELAELDIPILDRLWTMIYCVLDSEQALLFALDCLERISLYRQAARVTALAEWSAARAARQTAWGAAGEAWAAAGAVLDVAWDAAGAERHAARAAECEWQLARALQYARGEVSDEG